MGGQAHPGSQPRARVNRQPQQGTNLDIQSKPGELLTPSSSELNHTLDREPQALMCSLEPQHHQREEHMKPVQGWFVAGRRRQLLLDLSPTTRLQVTAAASELESECVLSCLSPHLQCGDYVLAISRLL